MSEHVGESSDEQLVCLCQAGDRDAFAVLVERHWDIVYGWLYRVTRSLHAAEDLTQETFCKAWAGLAGYQSGPGFRAWLFRIARNVWIDQGRRTRYVSENLTDSFAACEPSPLEMLLESERSRLLHEAIQELPADYREALLLRCQQSLSFLEIGEILGAKEDTIRWRVYKARQLLLKRLAAPLNHQELPS